MRVQAAITKQKLTDLLAFASDEEIEPVPQTAPTESVRTCLSLRSLYQRRHRCNYRRLDRFRVNERRSMLPLQRSIHRGLWKARAISLVRCPYLYALLPTPSRRACSSRARSVLAYTHRSESGAHGRRRGGSNKQQPNARHGEGAHPRHRAKYGCGGWPQSGGVLRRPAITCCSGNDTVCLDDSYRRQARYILVLFARDIPEKPLPGAGFAIVNPWCTLSPIRCSM